MKFYSFSALCTLSIANFAFSLFMWSPRELVWTEQTKGPNKIKVFWMPISPSHFENKLIGDIHLQRYKNYF